MNHYPLKPAPQPGLAPVGTIGHSHRNDEPHATIAERPIGHLIGDQIGVGDDHIRLVEGLDGGGAKANFLDFSPVPTDFDIVPHSNRSFKKQNEANKNTQTCSNSKANFNFNFSPFRKYEDDSKGFSV